MLVGWVGLGYENWTRARGHVCISAPQAYSFAT